MYKFKTETKFFSFFYISGVGGSNWCRFPSLLFFVKFFQLIISCMYLFAFSLCAAYASFYSLFHSTHILLNC